MKILLKVSMIFLALTAGGLAAQNQHSVIKTRPGQYIAGESHDSGLSSSRFIQGEITIKLKKGAGEFGKQTGLVSFGINSLDKKVAEFKVYQLEKRFRYNPAKLRDDLPDLSRIYKISFPESINLNEVVDSFSSDPNIEYAEAIQVGHTAAIPNDALYSNCQHLAQIFAPQAWSIHKGQNGAQEIKIAIVDTGVDWKHDDLRDNVWQNMGEDADGDGHTMEFDGFNWVLDPGDANGVDDDGNGFTDDLLGWNFITSSGDPSPIPSNPLGYHGTHCAGIAGGVTDNETGIASISWNLEVMGVCVDENNTIAYANDGIIYAAENGADIISNSWYTGYDFSIADQEVINYAAGLGSIIVAAAANDNISPLPYPASYQNVVSVASVSVDDTRAFYSNFNLAVDVSAPGGGTEGGILSTLPGNNYGLMSGTSMATPMIAGCFGLLKSYHPDWSNDQLITQLIGTADNIDSLNPDYVNLLGSGRVNAYKMLTEENVMPFLKLGLTSMNTADANENGVNEQGELVTLGFDLHNYASSYGAQNVNVSITSDDPDISIIHGTCNINIPPDSSFSIQDSLQIQVGSNASCHFAQLTIHFASDLQIIAGQDINFTVLANASGILVFEGEKDMQDYSGTLIASFLDHLGVAYTYSNSFPSLRGFVTAFLSYGNFGQYLDKGTPFTLEKSLQVQEFLEGGGKLYIEMGGMFYTINKGGYPNMTDMKQLFGVDLYYLANGPNPIDTLNGVTNSPMNGIKFTGSDQLYNWHIDRVIPAAAPASNAIIPFNEYNYGNGNVAIMNDGSNTYGQKTFYMGYSLAELCDRDATSSRYNVLLRTMEFLGYSLPQGYILSNLIADKTIGGLPLEVHFNGISISDPAYPITQWQWDFNNDGSIDSYDKNPTWTYNEGGVFDVRLITSNEMNSDTIVAEGLITVNTGYLVYDGIAGGKDFSGSFIRDQLQGKAAQVRYQNSFPESLEGFSAAFLSYGNWNSLSTTLDNHMAGIITDYLQNGGYVYLEGGDVLGFDQVNNTVLQGLFGLAASYDSYDYEDNPIDSLQGQVDALTHDMLFTGNSQASNSFIDYYDPLETATVAFFESNYGNVAVQYSGPDQQRTFCFSYALSKLNDGDAPNTREELLNRILNFFNIYTTVPVVKEPITKFCKVYPNPATAYVTIQYNLPENCQVALKIFNSTGREVKQLANGNQPQGEHYIQWSTDGLPAGFYYYSLMAGKQADSGKIIIVN